MSSIGTQDSAARYSAPHGSSPSPDAALLFGPGRPGLPLVRRRYRLGFRLVAAQIAPYMAALSPRRSTWGLPSFPIQEDAINAGNWPDDNRPRGISSHLRAAVTSLPLSQTSWSASTIRHDQYTETTPSRLQHLQIAKSKVRWPAAFLRSVSHSGTRLLLSKAPRQPSKPVGLPGRNVRRVANSIMQGRNRISQCECTSRLPHRAAFQTAQARAGQCAGLARGLPISVAGNSVYHACSRARSRLRSGSHSARTSELYRGSWRLAAHLLQLAQPARGLSGCLLGADSWLLPHPCVGFYRGIFSSLVRAVNALVSHLLGSTGGSNRWRRARPELRRPIL